jgi:hypothetical protein
MINDEAVPLGQNRVRTSGSIQGTDVINWFIDRPDGFISAILLQRFLRI